MTCPIGTNIDEAAAILRAGGLVAFPTETVYGLGANVFDSHAVARVFEVKERPRFDPLIVHIAGVSALHELARDVPPSVERLAHEFWPGPLTLVLEKTDAVSDLVTSGLPTVALRVPDEPMALQLLRKAEVPVAAPSANPFGRLSPTRAEHVVEQLGERIDYILDGGPCRIGVESTVLQMTGDPPILLRPGGLPVEEIEWLIGRVERAPEQPSAADDERPLSPGRLPRHYAPRTPLVLQSIDAPLPQSASRVGLLTLRDPGEARERFTQVEVLSERGDLVEAAAGFFAAMRRLDRADLDAIVATPLPEHGLGRALNDRLRRAAFRWTSKGGQARS